MRTAASGVAIRSGRPGEEAGWTMPHPQDSGNNIKADLTTSEAAFPSGGGVVNNWTKTFKVLTVLAGIAALLITGGAIIAATFVGMMVSGNFSDIVIAMWQALSMTKYLFNAFLMIYAFMSLKSALPVRRFAAFLLPSLLMAAWNLASIPHLLAYGYSAFWVTYCIYLILNRNQWAAMSATEASGEEPAENPADQSEQQPTPSLAAE